MKMYTMQMANGQYYTRQNRRQPKKSFLTRPGLMQGGHTTEEQESAVITEYDLIEVEKYNWDKFKWGIE